MVSPTPQLSVVVPVYNEAGNIVPLATALVTTLTPLGRSFEIIFVNDGSTDATAAEIAQAAAQFSSCRELLLSPNRGQAAALLAGLQAARGELIVTLDGDGQNDPRDIPALVDHLAAAPLDLVCGWRVDRHDTPLRRAMSRVAYAARRLVLGDRIHDAGCQLRVFRREVVPALFPTYLLQSFIPAIAAAAGFRVGELSVRHHARRHGTSKYGFRQLWLHPALALFALRWRLRRTRKLTTNPH